MITGRKEEILQCCDQCQYPGDTCGELLQPDGEAQIDLGINEKVSAFSIARRFVVVQLDNDFLPPNGL